MPPRSVVIVGGSLAGLLHGLQLKRQGSDVIILEQDVNTERHSHESGIGIGPSVVSLLNKYDATGCSAAIPSEFCSAAWRKRLRVFNTPAHFDLSNWSYLFNILRANFDGMKSTAVPNPPEPREGDGSVEYRPGKRVTGLSDDPVKGIVHVQFVDVTTGEKSTADANLVLAADGANSTVREIMGAGTHRDYAGYVAWRGTVPEYLVSKETVEYFSNRINFCFLSSTYFVCYIIPTEHGRMEPGERLINWVWYHVVPTNSPDMATIFTDIHGKLHNNTVGQGLVDPEVWAAQQAHFISEMISPLAEIITKTPKPFVTKVGDVDRGTSSFFDGRVVLVGDAFAAFRSHMGIATEQAARHCLEMDKVWRGEITQSQRDREAFSYAKKILLLNRVLGEAGLRRGFLFLKAFYAYVWFMTMNKLGLV